MKVVETAIPAVKRITPRRHGDLRGWFVETYNADALRAHGVDTAFVQDNLSFSAAVGTLRGLHYQRPPQAQGKLVRVARGAILDVAVDVRRGSPTYGRWVAETLTAENGAQLWVPRGFLHGFVTQAPDTEVMYKVDAPYAPDCDGAVRFDDLDLAIDWGVDAPVLSAKDAAAPAFADFDSPFTYQENP